MTPGISLFDSDKKGDAMSFFCLWIEQFPAWAIAQSEPKFAKKPFVVGDKGQVLAASPLAELRGIKPGMSISRAQSHCRELTIMPRDEACEEQVWNEVQEVVHDLASNVEAVRCGLLFADIEGKKMVPLVSHWGARGGQAIDRGTAHLAAITSNLGRVRGIRPGEEADFANEMTLESLVPGGLAVKTLKRPHYFNFRTVGAVRKLNRRQMERRFYSDADFVYSLAQGPLLKANLRPVSVWAPPEEINASHSFRLPCREAREWEPALIELLKQTCYGLGLRAARSIEVKVETAVGPISARRILKDPISQPRMLEHPAFSALTSVLETLQPLPPVLLGFEIRLGSLTYTSAPTSTRKETRSSSAPVSLKDRLLQSVELVGSRSKGMPSQPATSLFHHDIVSNLGKKNSDLHSVLQDNDRCAQQVTLKAVG